MVANFFEAFKIYSFVALENLYRVGEMRKNVHFNFGDKNVLEDESVLEIPAPNYDTLWMTESLFSSIVTH